MKKSMIPLVAIAFVVAVISTAVFYGLFAGKLRSSVPDSAAQSVVVAARKLDRGTILQAADLKVSELRSETRLQSSISKPDQAVGQALTDSVEAGEPITQQRLASYAAASVPKGMRAVSIRVSDSAGITGLLRPGSKVDVQAFSPRTGSVELRTILQNVEVLSVNAQMEAREGVPAPVVTVLTRPQDTDLIALADSGARIRVALRNIADKETVHGRSLAVAALFQSGGELASVAPHTAEVIAPTSNQSPENSIQVQVQILGASATALREIDSILSGEPVADSVRATLFRTGTDANEVIEKLVAKREVEILSSSRLTASAHRPAILNAGAAPCQLRVQFSPEAGGHGKGTLRVKPDVSWKHAEGVETRGFETEVPNGSDFVLSGFLRSQPDRALLERIFPGHSWNGRELVILVTSPQSKSMHTASLTRTRRRR